MAEDGEPQFPKPGSYEHIGEIYQNTHRHSDLETALGKVDDWTHEDNQNHLYNNVLMPAHDQLYQGVVAELDETFGDDTKKLHRKKSDLEKAVTAGLKKFFEKADPTVLVDGFDEWDEKDQHAHLAHHYDQMVGVGKIKGAENYSVRALINTMAGSKDATVGTFKTALSSSRDKRIQSAINLMNGEYIGAHLGTYKPMEIAAYIRPKIEEAGFDIGDEVKFHQMSIDDLLDTRSKLITGKDVEKGGILKKKVAES